MKTEKSFATLAAFKKAVTLRGYTLSKRNNPRIGDFWLALIGDNPVGTFCARYPRDSYLLNEADANTLIGA